MPDRAHSKLPDEWTIHVCPLCRGIVNGTIITHAGDCPNYMRSFRVEPVVVVPKESWR